MNTELLIESLASDLQAGPKRSRVAWPHLVLAVLMAAGVSLAAILLLLSRSPHIAHGLGPTIAFSALAGLTLAAAAFSATLALSYPEGRPRLWWLAAPAVILLSGLGFELADSLESSWSERLWGQSPLGCLLCVLVLSLPILAAVLAALRAGAPTHPRLAGAMAGLLAGGITTALYTLHCPEDSLLFVALWHGLAVGAVSLLGALAGGRLLRW
jgi:hypothetical protein